MTSPAIGASSVLGIGFEQLSAPVQAALATAGGGSLGAGNYIYAVTALSSAGETGPSNERTIATAASGTNTVTWAAVTGATGYNIYRTAVGGASGTELKLATVAAGVLTYSDTGAATPAGAMPTINTAINPGVYVPPVKFMPYESETLEYQQDTNWRRPIRNSAGIVGAVAGDSHIEGDINIEALSDVLLYFLYATRCSVTKSGTGPYTYTFTPTSVAVPSKTISITVIRNGQVFGYVGCVVSSFEFTMDGETLKFRATILGRDESVQSTVAPTFPVSTPFGAGQYSMQIPTATQVFDSDTFNLTIDDNGVPQYRMRTGGTGPAFINFGESSAELSLTRDFLTRADYDSFKVLTQQSITLLATKGASESIMIVLPVAIKDTYPIGTENEGDLIRSEITYQGVIDATGKHYQITIVTPTENVQ